MAEADKVLPRISILFSNIESLLLKMWNLNVLSLMYNWNVRRIFDDVDAVDDKIFVDVIDFL